MNEFNRQNYSSLEKAALTECVEKYKGIIENKVTNAVSNKKKDNAWESIAMEFNSIPGVTIRTAKQLRNCYKNLKTRAMKRKADKRIEVFRTGGGAAVTNENDEIDERLISTGAVALPLENVFDSDYLYHKQTSYYEQCAFSNSEASVDNLVENNKEDITTENEEVLFSRTEVMAPVYKPSTTHVIRISPTKTKIPTLQASENKTDATQSPLLKAQMDKLQTKKLTPTPKMLRKTRRLPPGSSIAAAALKEQSDVKTKLIREEHELMVKCKKEEHELMVKCKKEEHELMVKCKKEEHELQMEILKTKLHLQKKSLLF